MIRTLFLIFLLSCISLAASSQNAIQESHIQANVPAATSFDSLLQRDLLAFFRDSAAPSVTRVEYTLLRKGPTQSGVALPKYYLWVKAFADANLVEEGAVRLAAVEGQGFDILQFITKAKARQSAAELSAIFPAPLVPTILALANDQQAPDNKQALDQ